MATFQIFDGPNLVGKGTFGPEPGVVEGLPSPVWGRFTLNVLSDLSGAGVLSTQTKESNISSREKPLFCFLKRLRLGVSKSQLQKSSLKSPQDKRWSKSVQ